MEKQYINNHISGVLFKLEFSPDETFYYGENTLATSSVAYATSSMLSVNTSKDYLFRLDGGGGRGASTTIPLDFSKIQAQTMKISFKVSTSTDSGSIWARFVGGEKR